MNTLQNEMQRYLQVIERAEADPEVWGKLTEGTGIATANGYRAALKAAAQPVAPEQAPTAAMVRKIMHEELAALSENATPCDDDEILLTKSSERIAARLASQQVKGYSEDELRELVRDTWSTAEKRFFYETDEGLAVSEVPPTLTEYLASLSAKGEAPKEKYGAVVRAEDGAPYDALAELIKRGIKLARLRADIKSDVEDAFYSQTVAIEIDGVRTTAVTHERFNRMLNVLYDRWLPRSTPAAPEGTVSAPVDLRAVLLAYEQWEADVIADNACWGAEGMSPYPILCDGHWDRFIEIQSMRNEALGTWSKVAPVTNSVDSSLSVKDANQNAGEARASRYLAALLPVAQKELDAATKTIGHIPHALTRLLEKLPAFLAAAPSGVAIMSREDAEAIANNIAPQLGSVYANDSWKQGCVEGLMRNKSLCVHSGVVEALRRVLPILEKHSLWAFQLASDALSAAPKEEQPEPATLDTQDKIDRATSLISVALSGVYDLGYAGAPIKPWVLADNVLHLILVSSVEQDTLKALEALEFILKDAAPNSQPKNTED